MKHPKDKIDNVCIERYEELRALVLKQRGKGLLGLSVLLRQGVAGWMKAWDRVAATPPVPSAAHLNPSIAHGQHAEMARILAAMALHSRRVEVRA